jgi:hypothetical protein
MSPSRNLGCVTRYRRFESGFLQRRVSCEPIEIDKCAQCQPSIFRPPSRETPPSSEELAPGARLELDMEFCA